MDHPRAAKFLLPIVAAAAIWHLSLATPPPPPPHLLLPQPPAAAAGGNASRSCVPHERDALLAFKQAIAEDPYGLLESWSWRREGGGRHAGDEQDCCRWRGVRCSSRTGHVVELQLGNSGLVGQISDSLLSLHHLARLDLSMNRLNGSSGHIPDFVGSLVSLRHLNLSGVPFSGRVPPSLGNLSKLQHLDLSAGSLQQGQLLTYSADISWLAGLPVLEFLSMGAVNLSTITSDWPHVLNMVPSLKVLNLSSCSLISATQSLPQMKNLTGLQKLDLSGNPFHHPMATSWIWNLTHLQYLILADTQLYGQVPQALGDMTSLQVLDLSSSQNMGVMTANLKKLCNLTVLDLSSCYLSENMVDLIHRMPKCPSNNSKLQELYLGHNNITGILPGDQNEMEHLASLVILDISENNLTGPIPPAVGHLASLSTLHLSGNNLSGHVPSEIGMLTNLTRLDLSSNKLTGNITEKHFARLPKLKRLRLSRNSININFSSEWLPPFDLEEASMAYCQVGPLFPAWLRFQVNILLVDFSNSGIMGYLPDWFSATFSKATYLDISHNAINGTLPKRMEFMSVEYLFLSSNELTGQIPSLLPTNLTMLDLSLNSLSGNLPSKFGTQLTVLNLFSNRIAGGLPGSICEPQRLSALDLGNNLFNGELPRCSPARTLLFVLLTNNSFSGDFPPFLQGCTQLEFLDLSRNKFSGKLPHWIGGFLGLRFLRLSQNMFSGKIPTSITNLSHLHHLNLGSNRFSGVIPWGLSFLTAMTGKYVKDHLFDEDPYGGYVYWTNEFGDCFSAITKGQELHYNVRIFEMVSVDLSFNQLSGGIPDEIASLDAVLNLNLSWNHLSAEVPDKIGVMKSLESLDLSNNVLSGEIPSSLSNLSYLSYLDLSNNNLTGTIPSGRQLDTLYTEYPSMYSGNSGLCGPPLLNICSGNNQSMQHTQNKNEQGFELLPFYFGLGLGFMPSLWVVFWVLVFKKAWRVAYFCFIDKIYGQIYVVMVVIWKTLASNESTAEV